MKARPKSNLSPCPFCGGEVTSYIIRGLYFFKCQNRECGATMSFDCDKCNHDPAKAKEKYEQRMYFYES